MYISDETKDWGDVFQKTAQSCIGILNALLEGQNSCGPSVRDSGLLIAQFVMSNTLFEKLPECETSLSELSFIRKTLVRTCCGQLDKRAPYLRISEELGAFKFIDQIPLRLIRKILGIASGLPHKENDQFLTALLNNLNLINIEIEKILPPTPLSSRQGEIGLDFPPDNSSKIRTRKTRMSSAKQQMVNS